MLIDTKSLDKLSGFRPNEQWLEEKLVKGSVIEGKWYPHIIEVITTSPMGELQVITTYEIEFIEDHRHYGPLEFLTEKSVDVFYQGTDLRTYDGWSARKWATMEEIEHLAANVQPVQDEHCAAY